MITDLKAMQAAILRKHGYKELADVLVPPIVHGELGWHKPGARAYLNNDVIAELEQLKRNPITDPCSGVEYVEVTMRDDAIRQDEREKVLDLIIKESQTAREENRKIGRATIDDAGKEYRRGCAVGNKEIGEYAESLRTGGEPR